MAKKQKGKTYIHTNEQINDNTRKMLYEMVAKQICESEEFKKEFLIPSKLKPVI